MTIAAPDDTHDHRVSDEEIKFRLRRVAVELGLSVQTVDIFTNRIGERVVSFMAVMPEKELGR